MREKKRYLLVNIEGVALSEFKRVIESALLEWLGERGVFTARYRFIRQDSNGAWLKCATKSIQDVVAALAFKRFDGKTDVALRVVRAAGSVPKNPFSPLNPFPKRKDVSRAKQGLKKAFCLNG
jgi:RNase P/RNase MRP subunit POP5